jgi:probable H4MPT-linked C1 transfer pathway protein
MAEVLGLDIGGANLKCAHTAGQACSRRFSLWKAPDKLAGELRHLLAGAPRSDRLAVTMTGELCDCFESKREGVHHILDAVEAVAGSLPVDVWTTDAAFVTCAEARHRPLAVASANWLALATLAGRLVPTGPGLLIDVGTTTTDVIPLRDGRPVPQGHNDVERLKCGELVYLGWRRTPLCALLGTSRTAELFATTLDAYLVLGNAPEAAGDCETADGKPATHTAANRRLARMLGGDLETVSADECRELAREVHFKVVGRIALAVEDVVKRLGGQPRAVVAAGSGEFLVPAVLRSPLFMGAMKDCPFISLDKESGASAEACAMAVAALRKEALHDRRQGRR